MNKFKITTLSIALLFSAAASADYTIKIGLDKSAINLKQYYDNVGVNPDDNNIITNDPACVISQADLEPFGATILRVFDDENTTCAIDYAVPKATFSPDCTSEYLTIGNALTNVFIAKGVKGISSVAYVGECS